MQLKRLPKVLAVAAWFSLSAVRLWALLSGQHSISDYLIGVGVVLQATLFGYFIFVRREENGPPPYPWYVQTLIVLTIFIPYLFKPGENMPIMGGVVTIIGLSLSLWAVVSLGRSFGIAPGDRGLVTHGPYKLIRHPMYTGYLIMNTAILFWTPTLWNWGMLVFFAVTIVVRILMEERIVSGYDAYKGNVRWRIVPFVW